MAIRVQGVRLIDGTGREPMIGTTVIIQANRILAVDVDGSMPEPSPSDQVIDGTGKTMLPGLMDLHAGFAGLTHAEEPYGMTQRNVGAAVLRGVSNAQKCLASGVTTVRDHSGGHHGIFALREFIEQGAIVGPRILAPGRGLCMTGGHGWHYGCIEVDGSDEARKAARVELKAGAEWIKLMATGGAGSPTERAEDVQLTLSEMQAAVEEAHKKGRFAFAHVSSAEGARNAIAAGVDSIEHGLFLDEENVRQMAEKRIFLVPTLGVYNRIVERGERGQVPSYMYQRALKIVERHAQSFRMALQAGVPIAAGTDAGAEWYPMGPSIHFELECMNAAGMSNMDTLRAATSEAARCLHMEAELGTVERGKIADVVLIDDDPIVDISALRAVYLVIKEGRVVYCAQESQNLS